MHVCRCVCIYIYICMCVYIYIYIYIHIYVGAPGLEGGHVLEAVLLEGPRDAVHRHVEDLII